MKQEIKKGFEWYRTLSKKQQKQWKINIFKHTDYSNNHFHILLNLSFSFEEFIDSSFIWAITPQGHDYWKNIANKNK